MQRRKHQHPVLDPERDPADLSDGEVGAASAVAFARLQTPQLHTPHRRQLSHRQPLSAPSPLPVTE